MISLADPCGVGNPRATALPAAAKLVVVEIRELLVDGSRTAYRVVGAGKTVVLVHGLSGSWRWWEPVLEPLAERRRVHLLDLPRLGRRLPAAELTGWLGRWLEAAKLESVDLIGHSLGGLIAEGTRSPSLMLHPGYSASTLWWLYLIPVLLLVFLLLSITFLGDALDEALTPTASQ